MSHHQQTPNDRLQTSQNASTVGIRISGGHPSAGDEELAAEVDEPPESRSTSTHDPYLKIFPSPAFSVSKASLLTQGLLSNSDATSGSEAEAPLLTSDGGLTSPTRTTTPSPPPPSTPHQIGTPIGKDVAVPGLSRDPAMPQDDELSSMVNPPPPEKSLEAGLARRRCITFACGLQKKQEHKETESVARATRDTTPAPVKRPCMLKFACPFKPSVAEKPRQDTRQQRTPTPAPPPLARRVSAPERGTPARKQAASPVAGLQADLSESRPRPSSSQANLKTKTLKQSGATRFHEFAVDATEQDDWTKEQIFRDRKMTIHDTLRKENVIRDLAQEPDEEGDEDASDPNDPQASDDREEDDEADQELSDDGNESDDEGGFGDSDDESGGWSPTGTAGATTAATSTDHLDHLRWHHARVGSHSSTESMINVRGRRSIGESRLTERRGRRRSPRERHRPGTPDLPDSTDFVCGTFDEDRPMENAWRSCVEDRRRSKKPTIPQDVDPTFPTSDSDVDEEDEDEDEAADNGSVDGHWNGHLEMSDEGSPIPEGIGKRIVQSPGTSPRRLHSSTPTKRTIIQRSPSLRHRGVTDRSPPPLQRTVSHKSPPLRKRALHASPSPRQLFGRSPERIWSPTQFRRHLHSPPSTRLTSPRVSPHHRPSLFESNRLGQRPHLTHTSSMPRTPNPFWLRQGGVLHDSSDVTSGPGTSRRKPRKASDLHDRGPIDIVQGLEAKRQRRREKYCKQHCRAVKERRQHPGLGAQRMREIGLLSSERYRGYGPKLQLMLSI